ncbi:Hypothetical predicted protein [Olea europaea subsp. europaea]|uniref:Uncharacterized protein n=1 Tax=Olea europaea subsp. europaea TaxID=158383 RepID=A0A8S0RI20_OLEEU|nr:Hypothetical predicted protein [Olea europaea subsp. europaea]
MESNLLDVDDDSHSCSRYKAMPVNHIKSLRSISIPMEGIRPVSHRTFAAGAKAKKGSKVAATADASKASILTKEVKSITIVGANILKHGTDPKV